MQSPANFGTIDGRETLGDLIKSYFEHFGEKMCCFEDLLPYICEPPLGTDEMADVLEHFKRYLSDVCPSSVPQMAMRLIALLDFYHVRSLENDFSA